MNNQISQLQRSHTRLKLSLYLLLQFLLVGGNHQRTQSQVEIQSSNPSSSNNNSDNNSSNINNNGNNNNNDSSYPHNINNPNYSNSNPGFQGTTSSLYLPRTSEHSRQTTPEVREQYYGQTFAARNRAQVESAWADNPLGAADLIHWGRYFGALSLTYLDHEFLDRSLERATNPADDGYVGFYHYANGVAFQDEMDLDTFILSKIAVFKEEAPNGDVVYRGGLPGSKRETMILFCSYNVFDRSDFRARYVVYHNSKLTAFSLASSSVSNSTASFSQDPGSNTASGMYSAEATGSTTNLNPFSSSFFSSASSLKPSLKVDISYSILPTDSRKTAAFNSETIKTNGVSKSYWEQLYVSELLRLVAQNDNPQNQLVGLVNFRDLLATKSDILRAVATLVKYLPKGAMLPLSGLIHSQNHGYSLVNQGFTKASQYRNWVVQSLVKIAALDNSGDAIDLAVLEIKALDSHMWDFVILKLWKAQKNKNNTQVYITLMHRIASDQKSYSSIHRALVLLEQVKFLISKKNYSQAITIAQWCVKMLPLDFESWFHLLLAYLLTGDYTQAFSVFNDLPVVSNRNKNRTDGGSSSKEGGINLKLSGSYVSDSIKGKKGNSNSEDSSSQLLVNGIPDFYTRTFINSCDYDLVVPEKIFLEYFPPPREEQNNASMKKIWEKLFDKESLLRHPCIGNIFYQSPLVNVSAKELSAVDPQLIRACGPNSLRSTLASASSGLLQILLLNFEYTLTWGQAYDLLSLFTAMIGWDRFMQLKQEHGVCNEWVEKIVVVLFQDLRALMLVTNPKLDAQHSALEWSIIGMLGWLAKYNIREVVLALVTTARAVEFNYFATVQLLEIYNELVLSDISAGQIDSLHEPGLNRLFTRKLLLERFDIENRSKLAQEIEKEIVPLDFVLLQLMKLTSWNVRWYQYIPNNLVISIIQKLCGKHDKDSIRGQFRAVFESSIAHDSLLSTTKNEGFSFWGSPRKKKNSNGLGQFSSTDGIVDYMEDLVDWLV